MSTRIHVNSTPGSMERAPARGGALEPAARRGPGPLINLDSLRICARDPGTPALPLERQDPGQLERESVRVADQMARSFSAPSAPPELPGGHGPLPSPLRGGLESSFGLDLGSVRLHTSRDAGRRAQRQGALAYTAGRDIFFAPGRYRPHTPAGLHLLAHELNHVVQQARDLPGTPALQRATPEEEEGTPSRAPPAPLNSQGVLPEGTRTGTLGDFYAIRVGKPITLADRSLPVLDEAEVVALLALQVRMQRLSGGVVVDVTDAPGADQVGAGTVTTTGGRLLQVYEAWVDSGLQSMRDLDTLVELPGLSGDKRRPTYIDDAAPWVVTWITKNGSFRDPHGAAGSFGDHKPDSVYTLDPSYTKSLIARYNQGTLGLNDEAAKGLYEDHVEATATRLVLDTLGAIAEARAMLTNAPLKSVETIVNMHAYEVDHYDRWIAEVDKIEDELDSDSSFLTRSPFDMVTLDGDTQMRFIWRQRLDTWRQGYEAERASFRAGQLSGQGPEDGLMGALLYHLDPALLNATTQDGADPMALIDSATRILDDKATRLTELLADLLDGTQDPLDLDLVVAGVRRELGLEESYNFFVVKTHFNDLANDADAMHWAKTDGLLMGLGMVLLAAPMLWPETVPAAAAAILLAADAGVTAASLSRSLERWEDAQARYGPDLFINEDQARMALYFDVVAGLFLVACTFGMVHGHWFARRLNYSVDELDEALKMRGRDPGLEEGADALKQQRKAPKGGEGLSTVGKLAELPTNHPLKALMRDVTRRIEELTGVRVDLDAYLQKVVLRDAATHQKEVAEILVKEGRAANLDEAAEQAKLLPAYVGRDGNVYVNAEMPEEYVSEVLTHELMHTISNPKMRTSRWNGLSESLTQWHTRAAMGGPVEGYPGHLAVIDELEQAVGPDLLRRAYIDGDIDSLRAAVDAKFGAGTFDDLARRMNNMDLEPGEITLHWRPTSPDVPDPSAPRPDAPTPDMPTPDTPTPDTPRPDAPTTTEGPSPAARDVPDLDAPITQHARVGKKADLLSRSYSRRVETSKRSLERQVERFAAGLRRQHVPDEQIMRWEKQIRALMGRIDQVAQDPRVRHFDSWLDFVAGRHGLRTGNVKRALQVWGEGPTPTGWGAEVMDRMSEILVVQSELGRLRGSHYLDFGGDAAAAAGRTGEKSFDIVVRRVSDDSPVRTIEVYHASRTAGTPKPLREGTVHALTKLTPTVATTEGSKEAAIIVELPRGPVSKSGAPVDLSSVEYRRSGEVFRRFESNGAWTERRLRGNPPVEEETGISGHLFSDFADELNHLRPPEPGKQVDKLTRSIYDPLRSMEQQLSRIRIYDRQGNLLYTIERFEVDPTRWYGTTGTHAGTTAPTP